MLIGLQNILTNNLVCRNGMEMHSHLTLVNYCIVVTLVDCIWHYITLYTSQCMIPLGMLVSLSLIHWHFFFLICLVRPMHKNTHYYPGNISRDKPDSRVTMSSTSTKKLVSHSCTVPMCLHSIKIFCILSWMHEIECGSHVSQKIHMYSVELSCVGVLHDWTEEVVKLVIF